MQDHEAKLKFLKHVVEHGLHHMSLGGFLSNALGTDNNFQAYNPEANQTKAETAYNSQQGTMGLQHAFANEAGAQWGFNNQRNVFAQQQALANQLQDQSNGVGPNPALNQLNQTTAQNVANQGALQAGQRGAAANVGLIARQAGQMGMGAQQQAAGQAATLQAQQQIAARAALANQQAQMQNVSANQIAAHGQALTGLTQANQNEQQILQGIIGSANGINAGVAAGNQQSNAGLIGGLVSGAAAAAGAMAHGGMINKYAAGGMTDMSRRHAQYMSDDNEAHLVVPMTRNESNKRYTDWADKTGNVYYDNEGNRSYADGGLIAPALDRPGQGPQSYVGQFLSPGAVSQQSPMPQRQNVDYGFNFPSGNKQSSGRLDEGLFSGTGDLYRGGAGEQMAGPDASMMNSGIMNASKGGAVPAQKGQEAVKEGDSYANDKIPALLSQGELVIDRETMSDKGPMGQMARALAAHIQKRNGKRS